MTAEIVLRDNADLASLEELGEQLRAACAGFEKNAKATLQAAIRVGEILNEAREGVSDGEWGAWLESYFPYGRYYAHSWMRLAHYQDRIAGSPSFNSAMEGLRGLPRIRPNVGGSHSPDWMPEEASRLRTSGLTYQEIGDRLGVSPQTAHRWIDREGNRRRQAAYKRRRKAADKALAEQQKHETRQRAAKKAGGALAESYATLRSHLKALDQAVTESNDEGVQKILRTARNHAQRAEERILEALGVS